MVEQEAFPPRPIHFGNGMISATTMDFINGFQAGHLEYIAIVRSHPEPLTDSALTELFFRRLEDMRLSSIFGIGYITGWLHTLATKGNALAKGSKDV